MTEVPDETTSASSQQAPLLSICIPTCNRASFLRVMLQALLPQAAQCGSDVDIVVLDNASTDDTPQVLEESRSLGPFRVHRQPTNVGPLRNIIDGPTQFARGKFTWILGDHNLLRPGGLAHVLNRLRQQVDFQVFYVNFRVALYPEQWPSEATDGYDGPFTYLGNPELTEDVVERWTDLIRPYSAACTQVYAHIVRTAVWCNYWAAREIGQPYTSALTTYPHTTMLLHSVSDLPAGVLIQPTITIYNGAQSWGHPITRFKVCFSGLTDLLKQIEQRDVSALRLRQLWLALFHPTAMNVVHDCYQTEGRMATLRMMRTAPVSMRPVGAVFLKTLFPGLFPRAFALIAAIRCHLNNRSSWYVFNCRPARWLRDRWLTLIAFTAFSCHAV